LNTSNLVFQNKANAPSSNLFACENLVNATIADCYKAHNFIDELFNKASNLEEQAKQDDVYFAQLQSD
jgi:hypothetical protein